MEFKSPYLHAMREQAPRMFKDLTKRGLLEKHLQEKSHEAHELFRQLTKDAPKLPNGVPRDPQAREAEEQVRATLIVFPDEDESEPEDPLGRLR